MSLGLRKNRPLSKNAFLRGRGGIGSNTAAAPQTVSFTFTGPEDILPSDNYYTLSVSGLVEPYEPQQLISVEINLTCSDLSVLRVDIYNPDSNYNSIYGAGQISGADNVGTIQYNHNITSYPVIETGSAPYTGNWNDVGLSTGFDSEFNSGTINGDWQLYINNDSASTYTLNSFTLTFAY